MTTYKNGLVPRSAMKTFRNTGKFGHPDFISRLDQAFTAVQRELGIVLYIAASQDIFRDYEGQVYWRNYWAARGKPGNAAAPGTSNHGLGVCADISPMPARGTASFNRIAAVFARYNLRFTVASENWHVQDMNISIAGNVVNITAPAAGGAFSGNRYFPSTAAFAAVQGGYRAIGYNIAQDGYDGPKTRAAVSDFQRKQGLPVDGVHGPATEARLVAIVHAPKPVPIPPQIAVDGNWGTGTTKALQRVVGVPQDGRLGPNTYRAVQRIIGVAADGIWGTGSKKALQRRLGVRDDGVIGTGTIKALQARLNSGRL
jgi:hypothetical protein